MPLTPKGKKIQAAMTKEYGAKKGKQVMYASKNAGKIHGIDRGFYGHYTMEQLNAEGHNVNIVGRGDEPGCGGAHCIK
jgi:hypothetical protein